MNSNRGMHALLSTEQGLETLIRMGAEIDQKWLPFVQKHVQETAEEATKQYDILKSIQIDGAAATAASIMERIRLTTATLLRDQKQYQAQIKRCLDISEEGMACMLQSSKQIMEKMAKHITHQATVEANRMYQAMTHLEPGRITSYPDMADGNITNSDTILHAITHANQEYIEYDRVFLEKIATDMIQNAVPDYAAVSLQYNQACEELERLRNTNAMHEEKLERIMRKQDKVHSAGMKYPEQTQEHEESQHKQACLILQAQTDSMIQAACHAHSKSQSIERSSNKILKSISWERYGVVRIRIRDCLTPRKHFILCSSKVLEELEMIVKTAERLAAHHRQQKQP